MMNFQLKYVPATDGTVDAEWIVLREDGTKTDVSIQDCRSYGGGFAVNLYAPEGTSDDDFWMKDIGSAETLKAAFVLACKTLTETNNHAH